MKLPTIFQRIQKWKKALNSLPQNTLVIVHTLLFALIAALGSVCFLTLTNLFFELTLKSYLRMGFWPFVILSLLTMIGAAIVNAFLLQRFAPQASGSGIPQLKAAYWKDLGFVPFQQSLIKFATGVLSIGTGTSLGREGPTLIIGAGLSNAVAGFLGIPRTQRRAPAVMGAASGLAAAFNTPLASITFVLEEIVGDINNRAIGRIFISAVVGAFVVFAFLGNQPAFQLPNIQSVSWPHYLIVPLVAFFSSLVGVLFQKLTLHQLPYWKKTSKHPLWIKLVIAALVTWGIGVSVLLLTGTLGVFGLGYDDLSAVLNGHFFWQWAGVMVVAKLLATVVNYSMGGSGGVFSPLLFMGGMTGAFFAGFFGQFMTLTSSDCIVLSVVGMASCLGTVLKTPLSSLLIVFEMTHQFMIVPSLMIGLTISSFVSRWAGKHNFYDSILVQDGHQFIKIHPPRDITSWRDTAIDQLSLSQPFFLESLDKNEIKKVLEQKPYSRFPLRINGKVVGLAARTDLLHYCRTKVKLKYSDPVWIKNTQKIREVEKLFLGNSAGIILVIDPNDEQISGVLTLHDLIRIQAALDD